MKHVAASPICVITKKKYDVVRVGDHPGPITLSHSDSNSISSGPSGAEEIVKMIGMDIVQRKLSVIAIWEGFDSRCWGNVGISGRVIQGVGRWKSQVFKPFTTNNLERRR